MLPIGIAPLELLPRRTQVICFHELTCELNICSVFFLQKLYKHEHPQAGEYHFGIPMQISSFVIITSSAMSSHTMDLLVPLKKLETVFHMTIILTLLRTFTSSPANVSCKIEEHVPSHWCSALPFFTNLATENLSTFYSHFYCMLLRFFLYTSLNNSVTTYS